MFPNGGTTLAGGPRRPRPLRLTTPTRPSRSEFPSRSRPNPHATSFANTEFLLSSPSSAIITLVVGSEHRLFAAHEDVLCLSPFFRAALNQNFAEGNTKRIALPDEEPEIFSSVLEFMYKGDYYPRLVHSKRRNSWELEPADAERPIESTVYHHSVDGELLKDTVIYCAGEKYGLEELKKVSLRKQGLRKFYHHPYDTSRVKSSS